MTNLKRITAPFLAALAFGVAAFGTLPAVAAAAPDGSPTSVLHSFAFESEMRVEGATPGVELSISTTGVFVAPSSQDCRARVDLGALQIKQRAVIAGTHVYLDEGNGYEAVDSSDVMFREMCPSDPAFWEGVPRFPAVFEGVPDTHNGVKVDRYDFTTIGPVHELVEAALPGVSIDEFTMYLARKGDWPVGIETRLTGLTDEACASMGGNEAAGIALDAPCSMTRTVELSRPDDHRLKVKIPKAAVFN
jgi:hypothetical protein